MKKCIIVLICVFLQGCLGFLSEPAPLKTIFLSNIALPQYVGPTKPMTLKVQKPLMPTWLDSKRLFLKSDFVIQPLDDIELIEPMGEHLFYHLVTALNHSHLYKNVINLEEIEGQHLLGSQVEAFWIEKEGSLHTVLLKLSVRLIDETTHKLLAQRNYTCQQPLAGWSQADVIKGLETVVNQCINQLYISLRSL